MTLRFALCPSLLLALAFAPPLLAQQGEDPPPGDEAPATEPTPVSEPAPVPVEPGQPAPLLVATGEEEDVETVIVTGSKIEQQPSEITQSVRVVEQSAWEQHTTLPFNLSLVLQNEPGQFVNPLSRNDANWGSTGGLGPSYSSYLVDGLPVDAFVEGMSLDPWALTRVEQQRGPASVMYGNFYGMDFAGNQSPLAGITQFVTKDYIERTRTRLLVGGGSWGTAHVRAYHQLRSGNLHAFLGGSYERSDYTDYGSEGSWLHILQSPRYEKVRLYGRATWFFDRRDHRLSLMFHHTDHHGQVGRPNRDFDHSYNLADLAYRNRLGCSLELRAKAGVRFHERRWGEDNYPDLSLREHGGVEQQVVPADLSLVWRHLGESTLTFGLDGQAVWYRTYSEPSGRRTTGNEARALSGGVYAEEKLVLSDWVLRAGGRLNYLRADYEVIAGTVPGLDHQDWTRVLWSAGVRYNGFSAVSPYLNAGSSFMAPSAKVVGGTLQASDEGVPGKNGQLPNPDLRPQSGMGFDAGVDTRFLPGLRLGVRGFVYLVDDVIVDNVVSQDPSQTRSVNAGDMIAFGAELAAEYALGRRLDVFANATYTKSRIGNSLDADQDGADTPFVPRFSINAGASVHLPWDLSLSPRINVTGAYSDSSSKSNHREFGPYFTVSLKAEKIVSYPGCDLVIGLDLENLTDNRYEMPWQFRNPGFYALATLEIRI